LFVFSRCAPVYGAGALTATFPLAGPAAALHLASLRVAPEARCLNILGIAEYNNDRSGAWRHCDRLANGTPARVNLENVARGDFDGHSFLHNPLLINLAFPAYTGRVSRDIGF
jgi:hypothetical protein